MPVWPLVICAVKWGCFYVCNTGNMCHTQYKMKTKQSMPHFVCQQTWTCMEVFIQTLQEFFFFFLQCLCYLPFVSIKNSSHTHLSVDNVKSPNMSPASPLLAYSPQLTNRVNEVSAYLSARPPPRYRLHHPPQRRCWSWARLPQTAGSPPPGCLRGACRRRSWRRWTSGSWLSPVR